MKVRSAEELLDKIDEELKWRKREIDIAKDYIRKATLGRKEFTVRAGVVMLYAHWEGFIKTSAYYYLLLVNQKRLKISQLSNPFVALVLRHNMKEFATTHKASLYNLLLEVVIDKKDIKTPVPTEGVIKANDNLNSDTLKEILSTIGIPYTPYELKKKLIDSSLVGNRNKIAHGEKTDVDDALFSTLSTEIENIMENIKNDIINSAQACAYQKT